MDKNYIVFTGSPRVQAHLSREGIDAVFLNCYDEMQLKSIDREECQIAILMGLKHDDILRITQRYMSLGHNVYCYADGMSEQSEIGEPLSSVISSEDADKIELVAKNFLLSPCVINPIKEI